MVEPSITRLPFLYAWTCYCLVAKSTHMLIASSYGDLSFEAVCGQIDRGSARSSHSQQATGSAGLWPLDKQTRDWDTVSCLCVCVCVTHERRHTSPEGKMSRPLSFQLAPPSVFRFIRRLSQSWLNSSPWGFKWNLLSVSWSSVWSKLSEQSVRPFLSL